MGEYDDYIDGYDSEEGDFQEPMRGQNLVNVRGTAHEVRVEKPTHVKFSLKNGLDIYLGTTRITEKIVEFRADKR